MASYALNYALFGPGALSWHVINVALHALVCWLLWLFVRRLFGSEALAALSSVFFAVHALHVEVVAGVVGRAELLAAAGTLAALLAGLECVRARGRRGRILAAAGCGLATALAIGAKEGGVAAPFLIAMIPLALRGSEAGDPRGEKATATEFPFGRPASRKRSRGASADRKKGKEMPKPAVAPGAAPAAASDSTPHAAGFSGVAPALLASAAAVGFYLAARYLVLGTLVQTGDEDLRYAYYNPLVTLEGLPLVLTRLKLVGLYFQILVAPFAPSPDYSWNSIKLVHSVANPQWIPGAAVLVAWGGIIAAGRRRPPVWFGMMFLALALAPTSNLALRIGAMTAERWFYLPSAGLCLAAAWLVLHLRERFPARRSIVLGVAAAWAFALAAQTVYYLPVWRDNSSFYAWLLRRFPDNAHANRLSANPLLQKDDPAGLPLLRRAIDIRRELGIYPPLDDEYLHLFIQYMKHGLVAEREGVIAEATSVLQDPGWFHLEVADELAHHGEPLRALEHYAIARRLKPEAGAVPNHAGQILLSLGRTEEALAMFREATVIEPGQPEFFADLAHVLLSLGRREESAPAFVEAVRLDPENVKLLNDAAATLAELGRLPEALPYLERATRLDPSDVNALVNLGLVRLDLGDAGGARDAFERVLRLDPTNEIARRALGGPAVK